MSVQHKTAVTTSIVNFASRRSRHAPNILAESAFRSVLCREVMRSERSGNSLLLILVDFEGAGRDASLAHDVSHALCSGVRGTDVVGWYRSNECVGVIFTDLRTPAIDPQRSIEAKLKQTLGATLPPQTTQVRVSYHLFPRGDEVAVLGNEIFYPEGAPGTNVARILKRCVDVVGSLLALIALLPLLLLIALAIKLTSEGPVWCRQTRIGEHGRTFTFLKFRSMFHDCDHALHRDYVTRMISGEAVALGQGAEEPVYKIVDDPRVTPIGRILRRSSLDELPQLLNVVKGEMSLVGPRPPLPYEFERYSSWHRRRVLEVKPGLTGLWQVKGRSRTNFDEMVRLDLQYARQWSLWLDLKILLQTPAAVVSGKGAY